MYTRPRKLTKTNPKKMWIGGAIQAAGMLSSFIGGISAKKKEARELEKARSDARVNVLSSQIASDSQTSLEEQAMYAIGSPDASLYAKGGDLRFATPKKLRGNQTSLPTNPNKSMASKSSVNQSQEVAPQGTNSAQPPLPSQTGFSTKGGELEGIANGTDLAVGNKHGEKTIDNTSGIKVAEGGKVLAEIEDGEVVKDERVYSDRLKHDGKNTFASTAERYAKERGKLEGQLANVRDRRKRNSLERQISILDTKENELYTQQEAMKAVEAQKQQSANPVTEEGLPEMSIGGGLWNKGGDALLKGLSPLPPIATTTPNSESGFDINKLFSSENLDKAKGVMNSVTPFIDNIVNASISTPKMSTPLVAPMKQMDSNINVNPQLASIDRAVNASTHNVLTNTNNSSAARNAVTNARLKGASMKGEVLGNKQNAELQIKNQNTQMVNNKLQQDTQTANQHNMLEYQRRVGINQKKSGNVANLVDDFKAIKTAEDLRKNYNEAMYNNVAMDKTGATLRTYLTNPFIVDEMNRNPNLRKSLESAAFMKDSEGNFNSRSSADAMASVNGTAVADNMVVPNKAGFINNPVALPNTPRINNIVPSSTPVTATPATPVNTTTAPVSTSNVVTPSSKALTADEANARIFDTPLGNFNVNEELAKANNIVPNTTVTPRNLDGSSQSEKINLIRQGFNNINAVDTNLLSKIGEGNFTNALSKVREFTGTNVDFANTNSVKKLQQILGTSQTGKFTEADYNALVKLQTRK